MALRLLAGREHSRGELQAKLGSRGFAPPQVEAVLDRLIERGLLSDARFSERYVASRAERGVGPLRIRVELRERGVAAELIEASLDLGAERWGELLRGVHDKRFGPTLPSEPRERLRRARFLEYRGFPGEQVRRLLEDR